MSCLWLDVSLKADLTLGERQRQKEKENRKGKSWLAVLKKKCATLTAQEAVRLHYFISEYGIQVPGCSVMPHLS